MTTTEDNEAREIVAESIAEAFDYALFYELGLPERGFDGPQISALAKNLARDGLSALADAGYTVVKTEWEWYEGKRRRKAIPASSWEPVPEGSAND